jgi:hypothetical protein
LDGEEEHCAEGDPDVAAEESVEADGGDGDFGDLHLNGDAAFAVAVGELSGDAGEDDEGNGEAEADVGLSAFAEFAGPDATAGDGEREDAFEKVVVESSEELGDHEGEEALVEEFVGGRHDDGRRWWQDGVPVPGGWKFRGCTLSDGKARANRNRGGESAAAQFSRGEQEEETGVEAARVLG